ncbi:hypothetical protein JQN58_02000 [Aneurinibacillus sp. BA2021]|nr:hypothetical protein [Aneurinibacillus sp. BA2021]
MRKLSTFLLLPGILLIVLGIMPFVFPYPYSKGPHSGPATIGELILMLLYEGQAGCLIIGIVFVLLSVLLLVKSS